MDVNNSGASEVTGAVAPSVTDMIFASVAAPESNGERTTLDDLHLSFESEPAAPGLNADTLVLDEPRKRGRPRSSTTAAPAKPAPAKKKAELAEEVARLESELQAERARRNDGHLTELAQSIEMASYLLFGMAAEARGPHWAMPEPEAKQLGQAGAVALAPYADKMAKQLPWAVFIGVFAKAIYSRVQIDKALVAQLRAQRNGTAT
jgi:hypothetical protein